jgi:hypothetical protein
VPVTIAAAQQLDAAQIGDEAHGHLGLPTTDAGSTCSIPCRVAARQPSAADRNCHTALQCEPVASGIDDWSISAAGSVTLT